MQEKSVSEIVIGCAINISNTLGSGFFENVYENALCVELKSKGIFFEQQKIFKVMYKGKIVGNYIADLVVENKLIIELKALSVIVSEHEAQVINYLKASGIRVGLLLNFGAPRLGIRRLVLNHDDNVLV